MTNDNSNFTAQFERLGLRFAVAGTHVLSALATIEARRATRAQRFLKEVESALGSQEHRALGRLKEQVAAGNKAELSLSTLAKRLKRRPIISGEQSLVYGRVMDKNNNPVSGIHLSVEHSQTAFGEQISDEFGDFAIVICTMTGADQGGGAEPAWRLIATAEDRTVLFSSRQPFELFPGAVVYIEISVLDEEVDR
jgi:hypothetical protein